MAHLARIHTPRASVAASLAVLVIAALIVLTQMYVAIPLSPVLAEEFGGDGAIALNTAYGLAYGVGFVFWGPISDRYGRKVILVPGMAALTVATAGLAAAPSMALVAALRAGQGFAAASFAAVALAYIGETFPARKRPVAIGAVSTAFLVAGILGQVYGQAIGLTWGWRWVFVLAAVAFGLIAVALAVVLVEPSRTGSAISLSRRFGQLGTLLTRRDLALLYTASATVLLAFVTMYAAVGPHLHEFGLSQDAILWVRLAGLPGMALAPLAGTLIGRLGPVRVAGGGFVVAAIGVTAEGLAGGTLWTLVTGSVIFVAGIASLVPALITLIGASVGHARGAGLGLYGLVLFMGGSVGPQIAALPIGFSKLMFGLAAVLLLAAGLITATVLTVEKRARNPAERRLTIRATCEDCQRSDAA